MEKYELKEQLMNEVQSEVEKRTRFSAWGGKRAFSAWGGKRGSENYE